MTLLEHFQELRSRLFKASLGIVVGFGVGLLLSNPALAVLQDPYCDLMRGAAEDRLDHAVGPEWQCPFVQIGVADTFVLKMKIALWLGLIVAAPVWLYQVWAFIAPGLHRRERRWAYWFAGIATPLFAAGGLLAYLVVARGLDFLLQFNGPNVTTQLEITRYVDFVTGMMLLFGAAFEFPLVVVMFNLAGIATAKRLLGWWRPAVFLTFLFSAIATPTADPFGMTFLALSLSALYFAAVAFAFVNDRRRAAADPYANLADDEVSPIDADADADGRDDIDGGDADPVAAGDGGQSWSVSPVEPAAPVGEAHPVRPALPIDRRFDDYT